MSKIRNIIPSALLAIASLLFVSIPVGAIAVVALDIDPVAASGCQEDDPCWDADTMGNRTFNPDVWDCNTQGDGTCQTENVTHVDSGGANPRPASTDEAAPVTDESPVSATAAEPVSASPDFTG